MEEYQLTLVYPLHDEMEAEFEDLPQEFRSLFIGDQKYLVELSYQKQRCLAKRLGEFVDIDGLSLLEMNFISLLKKIFPKRQFPKRSIFLIPEKR